MISRLTPCSQAWIVAVCSDFDGFLLDHAANERKASAMAMTFVVRYPDRTEILEPMIQLAREELTHFYRVFKLMQERGLCFQRDEQDPYMKRMLSSIQRGRNEEFLDRLVMASVVEARGYERFTTLATALKDARLRDFYGEIAQSEHRHYELFLRLANVYFSESQIAARLDHWVEQDTLAMNAIPVRAALH